jgi:hypothetical protein
MGVTVDWANTAKTIALYTFDDPWNWDEFYGCWDWLKDALDASDQKVSILMDLRATRTIPRDSMKHLQVILEQVHPNFSRAAAFVGLGALSMVYNTVLKQVDPALADDYKAFFASTLEEASILLDDWQYQQVHNSESKGTP